MPSFLALLPQHRTGQRPARRLRQELTAASHQIRRHLDAERVLRAALDAVQRGLRPARASIWLTGGGELPRLACASGDPPHPAAVAPTPKAVLACARRWRPVAKPRLGILAVPMVAPQSGLLGVICVEGGEWATEERAFLAAVAGEAGYALEAANLYERAVAEKEKTEAILARVGDGVVVTDAAGTIRQWNEAAERIFGRPSAAAVGRPCWEVLGLRCGEHALDCTGGCALLAAGAGDRDVLGRELWRERPDGSRQPLLATVEAVRDPDGAVSEIVHSLRDITRLKEADQAKTMFLATASHELKTPLTVIQGFAQTLRGDSGWEAEDRETALEAMEARSVQLNKIVDRIMLSSRIETGRAEVFPRELDLAPIVAERVRALRAATGREIEAEVEDPLPAALADSGAATTVVDHLLDNAIKYSPGGEPVTVRAAADRHWVRLSVSDRGIGMDSEQAARCFEKFWQAESSDVRRFGGTGIGLYIVNSLVEAMDGELAVESAAGEGSTFTVALPRAGVPRPRRAAAEAPEPGVGEPTVIREFMRQLGIPARR